MMSSEKTPNTLQHFSTVRWLSNSNTVKQDNELPLACSLHLFCALHLRTFGIQTQYTCKTLLTELSPKTFSRSIFGSTPLFLHYCPGERKQEREDERLSVLRGMQAADVEQQELNQTQQELNKA